MSRGLFFNFKREEGEGLLALRWLGASVAENSWGQPPRGLSKTIVFFANIVSYLVSSEK